VYVESFKEIQLLLHHFSAFVDDDLSEFAVFLSYSYQQVREEMD